MIHVIGYLTRGSWEAECDDPSYRDMTWQDHATPQVARLTSEPSDAWLAACRTEIENELREIEYDPEMLEGERELKALNAWRAKRTFTGSYWDYEHGAIYPDESGRFQYRVASGSSKAFDTLASAESELFYKEVLSKLTIASEPVTFTWKEGEWQHPEHGRVHRLHECWVGDELAALMVEQQVEDDLA